MRYRAFLAVFVIGLLTNMSASQSAEVSIPKTNFTKEQENCLALTIYHEAKNQPVLGQMSIAYVVLNRVISPRYPNTICDVIKQGKYIHGKVIKYKCAFSFWCDGKPDKPINQKAWRIAEVIAFNIIRIYNHKDVDITGGATFYHADYVMPSWAKKFKKTLTVGNHIFYKRSGS